MYLYDRIISLDIGDFGSVGIHIEGLRISFRVEKTANRSVNTAEVDIYNLNKSTRELISDIHTNIIINAGYVNSSGAEVLFKGDIVRFNDMFNPPDRITHLEAGDGIRLIRETMISLSFTDGIKAQYIFEDIAKLLPGITLRSDTLPENKSFANGWSFVGPAAEALDKIANSINARWSIQNNELQIIGKNESNQTEAILISPASGLISSPERLEDVYDDLEEEMKPPGWKLQTFLQPKIEPGGIIEIESDAVSGQFIVDSVIHEGDTHGESMISSLEVFEQ